GDRFVVAASLSDGRADIDTRNFANGSYVLQVVVTNFMGDSVTATRNVTINNGSLWLTGAGGHNTGWISSSSNPVCSGSYTIVDTTGLGVRFAKIGESVFLLETTGSATFTRSEQFSS